MWSDLLSGHGNPEDISHNQNNNCVRQMLMLQQDPMVVACYTGQWCHCHPEMSRGYCCQVSGLWTWTCVIVLVILRFTTLLGRIELTWQGCWSSGEPMYWPYPTPTMLLVDKHQGSCVMLMATRGVTCSTQMVWISIIRVWPLPMKET